MIYGYIRVSSRDQKQEKSRALLLLDLFIGPDDSESVPERPLRKPRRMEYFSTLKHPVLRL